jgi:hypothetical protein
MHHLWAVNEAFAMAKTAHPQAPVPGGPLSPIPKQHVSWETWVWIAFIVLFLVLITVGFAKM